MHLVPSEETSDFASLSAQPRSGPGQVRARLALSGAGEPSAGAVSAARRPGPRGLAAACPAASQSALPGTLRCTWSPGCQDPPVHGSAATPALGSTPRALRTQASEGRPSVGRGTEATGRASRWLPAFPLPPAAGTQPERAGKRVWLCGPEGGNSPAGPSSSPRPATHDPGGSAQAASWGEVPVPVGGCVPARPST